LYNCIYLIVYINCIYILEKAVVSNVVSNLEKAVVSKIKK